MRIGYILLTISYLCGSAHADLIVDFESLPVNGQGFYNGDISAGSPLRDNYTITGSNPGPFGGIDNNQYWTLQGVQFNNVFNSTYGSWSGWSWSNVVDTNTAGFQNQYAAYPGGGSDNAGGTAVGGKYAVAFGGGYMNLPAGATLSSMDVTNTTYAALSMRDGDQFAKNFGGPSGNDPDFFRLTLKGYDAFNLGGNVVGSIQVSLADYTSADNSLDYILNRWIQVDLSSLSGAKSLGFDFESTDNDPQFGINTPAYFAMDNLKLSLTAVPEPSSLAMLGVVSAAFAWHRRRVKNSALTSRS